MAWNWTVIAAVAGASGVALGAFGAHGLKARVTPDRLAVFETAVRYQLIHSVALLALAALRERSVSPWLDRAGLAFVAGMVVFSGSLYLLVFTGQRWLGAITPLGGVALIAGWVLLLVAGLRS